MPLNRSAAALLSALFVYSLVACGGGGDSSAPVGAPPVTAPAAPTVTLNYGVKQLQFSWAAVSGATHYRLLERPDAMGPFAQVGADLTSTSVNHDIALHRRINAGYVIEACNSAGCTASSPLSVAANLAPAIGYLKASNSGVNDEFGGGVALSADGTTLAVTAEAEDSNATGINGDQTNNAAADSGAVYVFARSAGVWSQQAYLKASNTEADDGFGLSLALSADGTTLAVGAPGEASNATGINGDQTNNSVGVAGAVYVFTRNAGAWSQQAYVKASNTGLLDGFGFSVALSADGSTLAVGAPGEDSNATGINGIQLNNSANDAGAVYVFTRNANVWSQQAYVKASNTEAMDRFGNAVAVSSNGDTLVVGATGEDSNAIGINGNPLDNSASGAGAVYVFVRSAGDWSQQAYLKASNTQQNDLFGFAISLSADGSTLAVSASVEDSNATGIDGNPANNSAIDAGAVYVFTRNAGVWLQQAYVKASNTAAGDSFGYAIALSSDGNSLAIAAVEEGSNSTGVSGSQLDNSATGAGAVYVFVRSAGVWTQQAYVKASNTEANDRFGRAVALSADGGTLAVGANAEDSNATGVGGSQTDNSTSLTGAVYLY